MIDETAFRDPQDAFSEAVYTGRLSVYKEAPNYVGNFMYMGTRNGVDLFKHIETRQYLPA